MLGKVDDGPPKQIMNPQKAEDLDNLLLMAAEKVLLQDKKSKRRARLGLTASRVQEPIAITLAPRPTYSAYYISQEQGSKRKQAGAGDKPALSFLLGPQGRGMI